MPRLNGSRTTCAPGALGGCGRPVGRAVVDDDDLEVGVERADLLDHPRDALLLVERRDDRDRAGRRRAAGRRARVSTATSATDRLRDAEPEQVEEAPRPVEERVLVERPLAGCAAHLLRLAPGRRAAARRRPSPGRRSRRRGARGRARTSARSRRAGWRRSSRRTSPARTAATSRRRRRTRVRGG